MPENSTVQYTVIVLRRGGQSNDPTQRDRPVFTWRASEHYIPSGKTDTVR